MQVQHDQLHSGIVTQDARKRRVVLATVAIALLGGLSFLVWREIDTPSEVAHDRLVVVNPSEDALIGVYDSIGISSLELKPHGFFHQIDIGWDYDIIVVEADTMGSWKIGSGAILLTSDKVTRTLSYGTLDGVPSLVEGNIVWRYSGPGTF